MVLNLLSIPSKPIELENPNPIVYAHYTFKGLQAGIFLGSLAGTFVNLYNMYYSKTEKKFNWIRVGSYARNSILPFIIIIDKMCYDRLSSSVIQKNQSRAYTILKNQGQNLVDDISLGGLLGGAIIGALQGQKSIGSLFISASLGGLAGLLLDFAIVAGKEVANRH
ncbi:transmembrane protein, putative (macronuclear) [Tetrahymena thermophila SB210]|uniref:Transmembrane protein, putative n=1 Tax=Tetrahymena thermophila (strain SB210) TaxID=312017 RepID=Q22BQ5_TETTS|nr:transmembrane protein, putative [Tetrahymena thermophila SB210]EAR82734.1 transmembrane protein, putative [Tetrahymena thermophila SB210]|eukprot:XP_001030397.1 transmembrane protein, putative [Tetrahymena thermophila SB210]